jgi:hypothetical protein
MLQCLNKKGKIIENNNTLYTILVKYALLCFTIPTLSLKIKRVLMYRKKMDCTKEISIKIKMMFTLREITRIMANVKP